MKNKLQLCLFLLVLFFSSCHSRQEARQCLRQAREVMESAPERALALLDSVMDPESMLTREKYMKYNVLYVQAKYKNYKSISNDTLIYASRKYFEKKDNHEWAAQASLYSGCVLKERGSLNAATEAFKDAIRLGQQAHDSTVQAFAHYYIGDLLNAQWKEKEAVRAYAQADKLYGVNYPRKVRCQNAMAMMYLVSGEIDSALLCLDQALSWVEAYDCQQLKPQILNNYSVAYQSVGDYENAERCSKAVLTAVDSSQLTVAYLNLAKVYQKSQQKDSLEVYKHLLLKVIDSVTCSSETRAAVYRFFGNEAFAQGDYQLANHFQTLHEKVSMEIMEERERNSVYEIQRKYDFETQRSQHQKQMLTRHRVIIVLSLSLFTVIVILIKLAQKRKQEEAEINGKLLELSYKNEEERKQRDSLDNQLTALRKDELMKRLTVALRMIAFCNERNNPFVFKDLYGSIFEGKEHWNYVETLFEKMNPGWEEAIRTRYPELNEAELRYCMLSHFGFSRQEYANLMSCSVYYVDKIRASLNKKMKKA